VPNLAVAMNAWARLACYPRGNYYPMTNRASTRYEKVTKPYFRNCSTCRSHSKATLCLYTLQLISIQLEVTLGILRYNLVRDRPSQTACQTLSWFPDSGIQSEVKQLKGSVPRSAPFHPEAEFQSLLPTLCIKSLTTMPNCSKAPGVFLSLCG
jgi:hypothetical protein